MVLRVAAIERNIFFRSVGECGALGYYQSVSNLGLSGKEKCSLGIPSFRPHSSTKTKSAIISE
jgi:hypothetical protein